MKYRLKNTVRFSEHGGLRIKRAGSLVDDTYDDVKRLQSAGAILLPNTPAIEKQALAHLKRSRGGDEWDMLAGDHGQRVWKGESTGRWRLANGIHVRAHWVPAGTVYDAATENLQQVLEHGGVLYAEE